jgi:hypothetical protein
MVIIAKHGMKLTPRFNETHNATIAYEEPAGTQEHIKTCSCNYARNASEYAGLLKQKLVENDAKKHLCIDACNLP